MKYELIAVVCFLWGAIMGFNLAWNLARSKAVRVYLATFERLTTEEALKVRTTAFRLGGMLPWGKD